MPLNEDFLRKFKLKNLPPQEREAVESAISRTEKRQEGRLNRSDSANLIGNYISRFREILDRPDPKKRDRGLHQLKDLLHDQFLIKKEDIPESYYDAIKKRHHEEGHGDINIPDDLKSELGQTLIEDQCRSLDAWIDYLSSPDAKYPDSLRYWAFRSILKMGRFDKDKKKFTNREGKGFVSPFPELNREALAVIIEDMEKKYNGNTTYIFTSRYDIAEPEKQAYRQALDKDNFSTLYALAIDAFKPISEDLLKITDGEWRPYAKGSDPKLLVDSIADYGTGWCLRGESTTRRYLENNTLHIYYSNDPQGNPTIPRVVMVINAANQITEVRGVEAHEHLDSHIGDVVEKKLSTHPDGEKYKKKSEDMKHLTVIEYKTKANEPLTKDERIFLYEVDSRIEGFGYEAAGRDPRIAELRSKRNPKDDLPILFDCTAAQIALTQSEIFSSTKAYIGKLEPGIFTLLEKHNIDHIYTSFPEGRIRLESLEVGGMTAEQLKEALDKATINTSTHARSMLQNQKQFIDPVNKRHKERKGSKETLHLIRLHVRDLGYTDPRNLPTTRDLFGDPGKKNGRIHAFGLELCPPETGPYKRLADSNQPLGDWYYIGMEPIADSDGNPSVFGVGRSGYGLWLAYAWAKPGGRWLLDLSVVLCVGKSDT